MISDNFKDIVGLEDYFMISKFGDLWSKRSGRIMKLNTIGNGYLGAATKIGGRSGKTVVIKSHRAVALAWIDNINGKPYVNHIDGVKTNNYYKNLEWVTAQENSDHAAKLGLMNVVARSGVNNCLAKLNQDHISFIRTNAKQNGGKYTQRELGLMFEIHSTNIGRVVREVSYK